MIDACDDPCYEEWGLLIQADLDGELDIATAARLARHLETCPACAALQRDLLALSARIRADVPRETAPAALVARLQPARRRFAPRLMPALGGFSVGLALAASLALFVMTPPPDADAEVIAGHIRALQPGHLMDVVSTDSHTVKPWFDGRIDYAPEVRDFTAAGFPLIGGRLDYLGGRAVAALVYRHAQHPIDLYVWPANGSATPVVSSAKGYAVARWTDRGMAYVAVSDINSADLLAFARLWRAP